jgi:hypothetical protein
MQCCIVSLVMESTSTRRASCEHETESKRDCAVFTALSFVPGANKSLCVFHKREYQRETGERPRLTQGTRVCPSCNEEFEIKGATGSRARSHARKTAEFAFNRHVDTCATRQRILQAQTTHTTETN